MQTRNSAINLLRQFCSGMISPTDVQSTSTGIAPPNKISRYEDLIDSDDEIAEEDEVDNYLSMQFSKGDIFFTISLGKINVYKSSIYRRSKYF